MTENEVSYGIAAQLALHDFLQDLLRQKATGWRVEMTEPGSAADRLKGIDFYFISPAGAEFAVDVSLKDKPGKLVLRMYDHWFTRASRDAFAATNTLVVDPRKEAEIQEAVAWIIYVLMTAGR